MILLTINKVTNNNCIICYKNISSLCKMLNTTLLELIKDESIRIIIIDTKNELNTSNFESIAIPIIDIKPIERLEYISMLSKYPSLFKRNRIQRKTTVRKLAFTDMKNILRARQKRHEFKSHDGR